ncbi:MAG: OmpA family protein, partial [Beijerinckiaceae bacterium]
GRPPQQPGVQFPPPGGVTAQPGAPQPPPRPRSPNLGRALAVGAGAALLGAGAVALINSNRLDDVRSRREELNEDGVVVIREPGRVLVRDETGRLFIRGDETERYRMLGGDIRTTRQGDDFVSIYDRPDGTRVISVTDERGRLIRRVRRYPDGREIVIIDNGPRRGEFFDEVVVLPPVAALPIPRERYIVEAEEAQPDVIYETLRAEPVAPLPQRYTLDQVRNSPQVRARMPSIDVNSIAFATGSWAVTPEQAGRLGVIAEGIRRAIAANAQEVYLIEGHTDRVGPDVDNLSLSDRRAQAVAALLTQQFGIPPENLTSQGYGEQYPKDDVQGPSVANRRVTVRRITPLIGQAPAQQ